MSAAPADPDELAEPLPAQDADAAEDLRMQERRLGRWTAIGLGAALLGAIGGVLIELIFS